MGGDCGDHFAPVQPVGAVILIIDHQIIDRVGQAGEGRDQPCRQTVGIDRQPDSGGFGTRADQADVTGKACFQQPDGIAT